MLPKNFTNYAHILWSGPGHPEKQEQIRVGFTDATGFFAYTIHHVKPSATYVFKVQGLIPHGVGHRDETTPWAETTFHTKPKVQEDRVTALKNATTHPITFQWRYSNRSNFTSLTLQPGQQKTWKVSWSKATASTAPKVIVSYVGVFNATSPTTQHQLEGHVITSSNHKTANLYEFHAVGKTKFSIRHVQ
jgi:hypothetical protein